VLINSTKPAVTLPPFATIKPATLLPSGPTDGFQKSQAVPALGLMKPMIVAATPAQPVGAVADYAAQSSIVAHTLARELCPGFVSVALGDMGSKFEQMNSGYNGPNSGYDNSMVWVRDYHPTYVRQPDGNLKVVKYLSENPTRSQFDHSDYVPVNPPKPGQEFYRTPGASTVGRWLDTETMPIKHEDGNLVSTGEYAFMTDRVFSQNAEPGTPALYAAGYKPRQPGEVLDILSKGIDMPTDKMVVLPKMPGEATGHVDMFVMALGPKKVLLPQIEDQALQTITYPQEIGVGKQVQSFLDEQAAKLKEQGFDVERLPMMPPNYLSADATNSAGWRGHFYSPTNSLLVNIDGSGKKEAILPTFDAEGYPDNYKQLNQSYQKRWQTFFQGEGYEPQLVDATKLGQANGLFRCLTHPVPA
jgi:hypothetical protein